MYTLSQVRKHGSKGVRRDWGRKALKITVLPSSRCLVPHPHPRKRRSLFPVICATSFFFSLVTSYSFTQYQEKTGDVRRMAAFSCLSLFLFIPISLKLSQLPDTYTTACYPERKYKDGKVIGQWVTGDEVHRGVDEKAGRKTTRK